MRFVVLGDGGTGDQAQRQVAEAVGGVCLAWGCDFALYLGDNIYTGPTSSVNDPVYQSHFEEPYAALDFPFHIALGNHDYGDGIGSDDAAADVQVAYSAHSERWHLPSHYYTFAAGPVAFFVLDTHSILTGRVRDAAEQGAWLDRELASSPARWKIVLGHHPYISNGAHGNAGNFDGRGSGAEPRPLAGATLKGLVERSVCGRAQLYFAGHDHNREWLEPTCGTQFIVSGAAAKLRPLAHRDDNPTRYVDATKRGFLWVEIDADRMTGVFFDDGGCESYRDSVTR